MMAAPLVLGNDLRTITDDVLKIVTQKDLIAIDQDPLGRQAKRIKRGARLDILVRPLTGGRAAVCFFNRGTVLGASGKLDLKTLASDEYVALPSKEKYSFREVWSGESGEGSAIACKLKPDESKVFIIE